MPVFETPNAVTLSVDVPMGYVEIAASDRPDTVVEVTPSNPKRSGDVQLASEATVTFADNTITVRVPKKLSLFGPGDSVGVRVAVPTGSAVTVDAAYATVRTTGELGASRVSSAYGAVTLQHTASLTLNSAHGEVDVHRVAGDLDATTGHGRLRVDRVDGEARIKGSYGDIGLGTVGGVIDARTSGGVSVDLAGADVSIRSAHGAIQVREVSGGSVRLENANALVQVGVPAGMAAWVDAASQHAAVRNELTAEPGPRADDRTVELRLRNNYGDIIIHRALSR